MNIYDTREGVRLVMNRQRKGHWNRWGPFLSERAWGTVREDYSADGDAWSYFPHDHARSRAYRWNEDGLAGICDRHQYLCFALALWNGRDPILKERLFGLTSGEGNHGEDVKEYYFYLDNTPTHSYMKYLYKYPQAEYPYEQLLEENRRRSRLEMEYELVDTGIFDQGRYFDVVVEYAKLEAEDMLIRISISNRGPEAAPIHVLPTLWFRNTWSWGRDQRRPSIASGVNAGHPKSQLRTLIAKHWELGEYILYCSGADELLFTENETNNERLYGVPSPTPYVKDAFHAYVVNGKREAVNPAATARKPPRGISRTIGAGETITLDLRLASMRDKHPLEAPFADFDAALRQRQEEADEFYNVVLAPEALSGRQAGGAAGLRRHAVVEAVLPLRGHGLAGGRPGRAGPATATLGRAQPRVDASVYARRDLDARQVGVPLVRFLGSGVPLHHPGARRSAVRQGADHPDAARVVHAPQRADPGLRVGFQRRQSADPVSGREGRLRDRAPAHGRGRLCFMERVFQKMLLNFTWWVNRKDALGKNIFQGGFLGMDNIGAFDRDHLPPGYLLGQADGTSWMAAFAKSMLSMALLLAERNPVYEDLASKFWEHYIYIANAMNSRHDPQKSLWDEQDGFFYDYLISAEHERIPVRARTMVGFVPMFGASTVRPTPSSATRIFSAAASGSSSTGRIWSKASGRW